MVKIYFLERNNIPFYIGKTKNSLKSRQNNHKQRFKDLTISINELEIVNEYNWKFWESFYIELFRSWGFKLENKNNGGGGRKHISEEEKTKRRKPQSKETKLKKSIARIGKKYENISKALKGKPKPKGFGEKIKNNRNHSLISISKNKPIEQYNKNNVLIQEYKSTKEARYITNIKGIPSALSGASKTSGGYIWKYKVIDLSQL